MTGSPLKSWTIGQPNSKDSRDNPKDMGKDLDLGSPVRNAWEANGNTGSLPAVGAAPPAEQGDVYNTESSTESSGPPELPELPTLQRAGSSAVGLTQSTESYGGSEKAPNSPDGKSSSTPQSKNQKYRITTKKLLEGILDETQRQTILTSHLCVNPESLRGRCLSLVRANSFTYGVSMVVIVNAAFIGVETQLRKCDDGIAHDMWYAAQVGFSLTFLAELGIRLFAERSDFWRDLWNYFDAVLVLASAADTFFLQYLVSGSTLDLIVALRIARLARLVRIFRLLRFFKELWFLVAGIFDATRTLAWAWLLICFMMYIPAIFATRVFGKKHEDDEFLQEQFGTIPRSMYTLFTVLTMEGWSDIARRTMKVEWWSWMFFIAYIFLTTFAIMNVVVAVIVQNTLEHASHCHEEERQAKQQREQQILAKIVEVFEVADADGDGELTRPEFLQSLDNAKVVRHLHEIGVDVRQAENLFDILDYDESGCLDLCEFVEGVLRARGEAKAKDILAVQCDMWRVENRLLDKLDFFATDLQFQLGSARLAGTIAQFKDQITGEHLNAKARLGSTSSLGTLGTQSDPRTLLKLRVTIVRAKGLRDADLITKSDPYCLCEVHGKPDLTFRTATIKDELNPNWEHTFEISDFAIEDLLVFTVLDEDIWPKPDDFLGRAVLKSALFYPNGFEGELKLLDGERRNGHPARLQVRVLVLLVAGAPVAA